MNPRSKRRSGIGWSASVIVLAIGLLVHLMGGFNGMDGRIHDHFHQFTKTTVDDRAVLLVECSPSILDRDNPRLFKLLSMIAQASPKVIGVVSERAPLLLGSAHLDQFDCSIVEGRPAADIADKEALPTGFSELSFDPQPIFRFADQQIRTKDRLLPSFERLLAAKAGFISPQHSLGLRFGANIHAIPRVSASQILEQNFIPEMINNRVVIVGEKMPHASGAYTPVSHQLRMPRLELRGHAVLTILQNNPIRKATAASAICILVSFWAFLSISLRSLSHRHLLLASFSVVVLSILSCCLTVSLLSTWLPASALLMFAVCIPGAIWLERFEILSDVVVSRKIKLNANPSAASTVADDSPWQSMATALNQFFAASRIALFEVDSDLRVLKFVPASGCVDEADIFERRRDFSRNPWQQSIELGRASKNLSRLIFNPVESVPAHFTSKDIAKLLDVTEFLVPLKSGTQILGFMVLEMSNKDVELWSDFENVLNEFAIDFARLLGQHISKQEKASKWRSAFQFPELIDAELIERSQTTIDAAINQVEQAFESDSCCRILLNAFGRVVKSNSRMIRRLDSDNAVHSFDFIELVCKFSDVTECEARNIFRTVVISDQRAELATAAGSLPGTIVVSPVDWNDASGRDLFSRGILLEIFDKKEANASNPNHASANAAAAETNFNDAFNNLTAAEESILAQINDLEMASTCPTVDQSQQADNFKAIWQAALFNVQPKLEKKNIEVETAFATTQDIVLPNQNGIANALEICLAVLSDCSHQSQTLKAQLKEKQSSWSLTLRNGHPDVTNSWSSPQILGANQTYQLHEARKKMQSIGGRLDFQDTLNGELLIELNFVAYLPTKGQSSAGREVEHV